MKAKVNLTLDRERWRQFRVACIQHDISASAEIESFMAARLQQWERHPAKPRTTARRTSSGGY